MSVSAVAIVVALALVCVLGVIIARLQMQVRRMTTRLASLTPEKPDASAEGPAPQPQPDPEPPVDSPTPSVEGATASDADEVPVITAMGEAIDNGDLTTGRVASVTLGGPMIKVAALSHGLRRALDEERRMRIAYAVRKELRRQRKIRRRRRAWRAPAEGWKP